MSTAPSPPPPSETPKRWEGPRVDVTVDVVPFVKTKNQFKVLLGRKDIYKGWILIGGHLDPKKDRCFKDAAIRELKEETELEVKIRDQLIYHGDHIVKDPRLTGTEDAIFTNLYSVEITESVANMAAAHDDLKEVKWFDACEFVAALHPHHKPLGKVIFDYLFKPAI